jgi:hypothetical protein
MRRIAVLITAGVFALACAGTALAAPSGPEGPGNCTFANGVTTCSHVGQPVVTTTTSSPDVRTGCTTTTTTTTTTTSYTAHHGTYNSSGEEVTPPADMTSSTTSDSTNCPPHGSVDFGAANTGAPVSGPSLGTVYWYVSGSNVHTHAELTNRVPNARTAYDIRFGGFYPYVQWSTTDASGDATFDVTFAGLAGQRRQFDSVVIDSAGNQHWSATPFQTFS